MFPWGEGRDRQRGGFHARPHPQIVFLIKYRDRGEANYYPHEAPPIPEICQVTSIIPTWTAVSHEPPIGGGGYGDSDGTLCGCGVCAHVCMCFGVTHEILQLASTMHPRWY